MFIGRIEDMADKLCNNPVEGNIQQVRYRMQDKGYIHFHSLSRIAPHFITVLP